MKRLQILLLLLVLGVSAYPQAWKRKRIEVWGGVSIFQYFGDIGGSAEKSTWFGLKDIKLNSTRPGLNVGVSYRLEERIYIYGSNSFGVFSASDKNSRNSNRNYAFYSIANEFSIQAAFYLLKENQNYYYSIMKMRGGLKRINQPLSVYVFAGFGGLFTKPFAKNDLVGSTRFNDKASFSLAFPIGIGAKLAYTPKLAFGVELGARYVLSDQLDGFTTLTSKHNDLYYMLSFKAIFRLTKGKGLKQIFSK